MTERPITLDLGMSRLGGEQIGSGAGGDQPNEAREDDVSRFRHAFVKGEAAQDGEREKVGAGATAPQGMPAGAFGLFGAFGMAAPVALAETASAAPLPRAAAEVVGAVAERILVASDGSGEVRIQIRSEILPGVEVRIVQEQGRWVVNFAVVNANSLGLLQSAGQRVAAELSRRLKREVEVRVADPHAQEESGEAVFVEHAASEETSPSGAVGGPPLISTAGFSDDEQT